MQIKGLKCVEKNEQVTGFEIVLQKTAPEGQPGETATVMLGVDAAAARKFRVGTEYAMSFRTDKGEKPEPAAKA
jgi:hypothetical protein